LGGVLHATLLLNAHQSPTDNTWRHITCPLPLTPLYLPKTPAHSKTPSRAGSRSTLSISSTPPAQSAAGQAAAPPPAGGGASTSSVTDSVANTAQQRRDILLAELAALGYPPPAVAPAAPVGLDWQLAQARASEVAVKVAHAAQVKANEAEILQLRLNIATREQKLAEDAAAAAQARAAAQSATAHTVTAATADTPMLDQLALASPQATIDQLAVTTSASASTTAAAAAATTASALVNTLPPAITTQAVTTTVDTPMLHQSALAPPQAATDQLVATANADAANTVDADRAAALALTTAQAAAVTHTAGPPAAPSLDPATLTAALQAAAAQATAAQDGASQTCSSLSGRYRSPPRASTSRCRDYGRHRRSR
jgi:hypothetical protein